MGGWISRGVFVYGLSVGRGGEVIMIEGWCGERSSLHFREMQRTVFLVNSIHHYEMGIAAQI